MILDVSPCRAASQFIDDTHIQGLSRGTPIQGLSRGPFGHRLVNQQHRAFLGILVAKLAICQVTFALGSALNVLILQDYNCSNCSL